ncbi:hypothetical protein SUGI_0796510 [Cryptomeria japonica]|nr:hypothetical protein SUGI_0796510 [Cryptomeria japonica]
MVVPIPTGAVGQSSLSAGGSPLSPSFALHIHYITPLKHHPLRQLVTIDFLGINSNETAKENTTSAMDCQPQLMKRRAIQSCLTKIKTHMLQQVLSQCGVSKDLKTMEFSRHSINEENIPSTLSPETDGQVA